MLRSSFYLAALAACVTTGLAQGSSSEQDKFADVQWDDDNWVITTHTLDQGHYQSRLSLANGYFGINVAAVGPFFEVDTPVDGDVISGWPLFSRRQTYSTIAGFWNTQQRTNGTNYPWLGQYGWESFTAGIPHWSNLEVEANGEMLNASVNPDHVSQFITSLDLKAGVASWRYTWRPGGGNTTLDIDYQMFVHKLYVNKAAVRLRITASRDVNVTVYDLLDGECAVRSDFANKTYVQDTPTIFTAVHPGNISNVTAYVYSTLSGDDSIDFNSRSEVPDGVFSGGNGSTIAQSVQVSLRAFQNTSIYKFVGVASTDAFPDPQSVAQNASTSGPDEGYSQLLQSHAAEWASILTPDSVDDYHLPNGSLPSDPDIQQLHILARTNPFFLLSNMVGPNAIVAADNNTQLGISSVPVGGLGSDSYAGMIFWDADVWMAPGIQVSHPLHAQNIIKYRVDHFGQAQENTKTAYQSSKNQTGRFTPGGAVYPWTSARYGNCTGTGPCFDYEYHLNGDIVLAFNNHLIITGDGEYFNDTLLPISNAIAHFFGQALDFNETSGNWELLNATDPDEYANMVNNVAFTTALIKRHFTETNEFNSWFGIAQNETWNNQSSLMQIPINENANIIVEYDGMNGTIEVKQADVILIDDLLHYPNPYSLADLDYYAAKQSLDGPAMTYSSFSVVANEVSPSGCSSYTYDIYSSAPYVRAPWYQYSEQLIDNVEENGGTHPAFPFLTGMGGTNRVSIFGYLGLGLYYNNLDIDPSLPPQIEYLNYRTFYWHGHGINATSNATHTTLARLPRGQYTLPNANATYFNASIPVTIGTRAGRPQNVTYTLSYDTPLVVPNRQIGQQLTVAGNILQCGTVLPPAQGNQPGQFPLAAIDGAASTKWQPETSNVTSWLVVDLGSGSGSNNGSTGYFAVGELLMDWGNLPPERFAVWFTNSSSGLPAAALSATNSSNSPSSNSSSKPSLTSYGGAGIQNVTSGVVSVNISQPYDPVSAYEIQTYVGNQTNVTLSQSVWSGRYAVLGIEGNMNGSTEGGTVAEWSLVRVGA